MKIVFVLIGFALAVLLGSTDAQNCNFDVAQAKKAVNALNTFSLKLYKHLIAQKPHGNLVMSPASIAMALSMLEAGADGYTKSELFKVLADAGATGDVATFYQALQENLQKTGNAVTMKIANALYVQPSFTIKDQYKNLVTNCFKAKMDKVDFTKSEAARQTINSFVSTQTNQKIPELFKSGTIDASVKAVLVNAIYLKGNWRSPFDKPKTKTDTFTRSDGQKQQVPFMNAMLDFYVERAPNAFVLKMPFVSDFAMYFVVPKPNVTLATVEQSVNDAQQLNALLNVTRPRIVSLSLPKFGIRTPVDLKASLPSVCVASMFHPGGADFTKISDTKLHVGKAMHEAFIKIDEMGVEAAAATAATLSARSLGGPLEFNQPFMYAIKHEATGAIVFMGKVNFIENA